MSLSRGSLDLRKKIIHNIPIGNERKGKIFINPKAEHIGEIEGDN